VLVCRPRGCSQQGVHERLPWRGRQGRRRMVTPVRSSPHVLTPLFVRNAGVLMTTEGFADWARSAFPGGGPLLCTAGVRTCAMCSSLALA
jgi:hypothetical protein